MTLEATRLDISAMPEVERLADEVARTRRPHVLFRGDEELAVIVPATKRNRTRRKGTALTAAQRNAFLSSAGGWQGIVDVERFKRDVKAARSDHRPPVAL